MKIEGKNAVAELLKTDKTIDKILIQNGTKDSKDMQILKQAKQMGIKVQFVDKFVLDGQSETHHHQGFIAYVSDFVYSELDEIIDATKDKENGFVLLLDGIEDPHNLGSIIRVSECAGCDGVIIGKRRSACVNETVMRVSEGSCNHVKIARVNNLNNALETLKENGYWAYGLELGGEDIYSAKLTGKIVIVVGGEDTGINRLTKEKCDKIVTIPMYGKINSLNASVACGVAVFEAVRQRNAKN